MIHVNNHTDLLEQLKGQKRAFVFLYKSKDSEQSKCAYSSILEISKTDVELRIIEVDVSLIKDIHQHYNITSVPTLLEFNNAELKNTIKGCHDLNYYRNIIEGNSFAVKQADNIKPQKSVAVYSTPSCSWCTTLKNYLKDNHINFRDIDVSRDAKAAENMVKRSGQQGVPQTTINNEVIIGFDKTRLDKLLGIQSK